MTIKQLRERLEKAYVVGDLGGETYFLLSYLIDKLEEMEEK